MAGFSLATIRTRSFTSEELAQVLERAATLGLQMRVSPNTYTHAPISLLPSPVPEREFLRAKAAMPLFNRLVDTIARDRTWLYAHLEGLDDFTSRLVAVSKACGNLRQRIYLGINRSDYMLDAASGKLKQVEINTIASSFGGLASILYKLHLHTLHEFRDQLPGVNPENLPQNGALQGIIDAIHKAQQLQGSNGAVLMVITPKERNLFDQQKIEVGLWKRHRVRSIRATFLEVFENFSVDPATGLGTFSGSPVSVVYYRAGYSPDDYQTEEHWKAREKLEQSSAVKCPCIDYHLAGVKKVQQLLCLPEHLQRFMPKEEDQRQLREFFTTIIGLDQPLSAEILAAVRANPGSWVLKPMREGGGNNLYDAEMLSAFANYERDPAALRGFILMQKIIPQPFNAVMLRDGKCIEAISQWELGVFGTYLCDSQTEYLNASPGHLLRTKSADSNEGGVAAGFAVIDSPYLV